jgi:hypothetical protein
MGLLPSPPLPSPTRWFSRRAREEWLYRNKKPRLCEPGLSVCVSRDQGSGRQGRDGRYASSPARLSTTNSRPWESPAPPGTFFLVIPCVTETTWISICPPPARSTHSFYQEERPCHRVARRSARRLPRRWSFPDPSRCRHRWG